MTGGRLSLRALNRVTLDRQLLLHRAGWPAGQAVAHLAGMQSQAPLAPYVGLWARVAGFRPAHLENLLTERAMVRAHVMRNTVHLTDARDFAAFRPLFQPLIDRALRGSFGRRLAGVVQVPPRGRWSQTGPATFFPASAARSGRRGRAARAAVPGRVRAG